MGRYNFVSGGAAAGNAISQFLAERETQNRQRMLDQFLREKEANAVSDANADRGLRERDLTMRGEHEQRMEAEARLLSDALAYQREGVEVDRSIDDSLPGALVSDASRARMDKHGREGAYTNVPGVLMQGPMETGDQMSDADRFADLGKAPDSYQMRGGSQYLARKEALDARAEEAEAARVARLEDHEAQRVWQAGQNELSRQNTFAIGKMGADIQTGAAATKEAAKALLAAEKVAVVKASRADVRELAQGIIDDPELDGVTGIIEGRRETFYTAGAIDVKRRLDQLIAKIKLRGRDQLKGQGTITDFEGKMLSDAESAIDRQAGPDILRGHLRKIVEAFAGDAPNAPKPLGPFDPTGGGAASGGATDPNARAAQFLKGRGRGNGR